jgi:hypothetical protein
MDVSPEGERAGASESIEARVNAFPQRVQHARHHTNYPRRESNPHLRFRKPPFYPLNYGDWSEIRYQISEVRFQIQIATLDCPSARHLEMINSSK